VTPYTTNILMCIICIFFTCCLVCCHKYCLYNAHILFKCYPCILPIYGHVYCSIYNSIYCPFITYIALYTIHLLPIYCHVYCPFIIPILLCTPSIDYLFITLILHHIIPVYYPYIASYIFGIYCLI
jgi:hypothetical protein